MESADDARRGRTTTPYGSVVLRLAVVGADEQTALDWAARASKALGGRIEVRAFQEAPGA